MNSEDRDQCRKDTDGFGDQQSLESLTSGPNREEDAGGDPAFSSGASDKTSPSGDGGERVVESSDHLGDETPAGDVRQVGSRGWVISERPRPRSRPRRENAMKHGAYANSIPVIAYGPLREDPEEVMAFYKGVEADLQPGDSAILRAQVRDIASLQWRLFRLQKWEADGYSLPESQTEEYEPDRSAYFASERELASWVLERLGDREVGWHKIKRALVALVQVTEEADLNHIMTIESLQGRDRVLSALIEFVDGFYGGDLEQAASRLTSEARILRQREREGRLWDSLVGARVEMSSDFTRSLLDAIARTNRELDRAIARFRLTKQTLMSME